MYCTYSLTIMTILLDTLLSSNHSKCVLMHSGCHGNHSPCCPEDEDTQSCTLHSLISSSTRIHVFEETVCVCVHVHVHVCICVCVCACVYLYEEMVWLHLQCVCQSKQLRWKSLLKIMFTWIPLQMKSHTVSLSPIETPVVLKLTCVFMLLWQL